MCKRKVLICLFFIYISNALARDCSDCKLFRSCPEAISFAAVNKYVMDKKLKSALCGSENVNGEEMAKICCSDFATTSDRSGIPEEPDTTPVALKDHPNFGLLPDNCGQIDGGRIVGGTVANLWEFPWMALISYRTRTGSGKNSFQFRCGGTIINSRYILTAAHCVVNKKLAGVRIGEFDISTKDDCQGEYPNRYCENHIQDIIIEDSIPHKDYVPVKNDIALLRLKTPIDLTVRNTKPVCLPKQEDLLNATLGGKIGTVAGWGITETGTESLVLRKVDIPILTRTACQEFYNKNSPKTDRTLKKLCAGELKKDSCRGDSGGPLMREEKVNGVYRMIQYGIVSYGPQQCGSSFPGVYTDLTYYMDWILDNIKP